MRATKTTHYHVGQVAATDPHNLEFLKGMRLLFIALILAAASFPSHAKCTAHDVWSGDDKNLHFAAGMAIAGLVTAYTDSRRIGFYTSTAVGVAKEVADALESGECSLQDLAVTAAGATVGAYMGHFYITRTRDKTVVTYAAQF